MDSLGARALIHARSPVVWKVLTDSGKFQGWDSGIIDLSGEARNGGIIRIRTRACARTRLRVEQLPGKVMTWTRGEPPLYSFVRTFSLTPEAGLTLLTVKHELFGPWSRLVGSPWAFTNQNSTVLIAAGNSERKSSSEPTHSLRQRQYVPV